MQLVVRAFPVRKTIPEVQAFAEAMRTTHREGADAFYRQYGVSYESWHLQLTAEGPWVISVTAVDDPVEAAPRYAASAAEFDRWFKSQVLALSGVDPEKQPLGPPTTQIYRWSDGRGPFR